MTSQPVIISLPDGGQVSGLLQVPPRAKACYVLAHGAGAGMTHLFMEAVADELAARGVATMRYQFPYMERGSKRPDQPPVAHATVRAAVEAASRLGLPLIAGGRSFGGRMTSQAQALSPLSGVQGLAFLGFPLHPAGRPSSDRAQHLADVQIPMLFLQGTRDELAHLDHLQSVCERLGATLKLLEHADHSFHAPAHTGRKEDEIRQEMLDAFIDWMRVEVHL